MVRTSLIVAGIAALAASPASSAVDLFFAGDGRAVSSQLANFCLARNINIVEQDEYHVVCSAPVTGFRGVLTQALIGNSYSTAPSAFVRFAIVVSPQGTRVQATQWLETQMAFGQIRRVPIEGEKNNRALRDLLVQYGGSTMPVDQRPPTPRLLPGAQDAPRLPSAAIPTCDQQPKPDPCVG